MTDEATPPRPRNHRGGGFNPERRPGRVEAPGPERRAAARAIFEAVPGSTCETVAAEVGVAVPTVRRWKAEDKWAPAVKALPDLSARASALANSFKTKMSDLGKPLDDGVAAAEAAREVATDLSVDLRAQVLDRHRKEWAAPRQIAYQAIQESKQDVAKAFERAKLAKITSETLTLIQAGECRAFGITAEARGADGATVVVVERGSAPAEAPAPPLEQATGSSDTATTPDDDGEVF